MSGFESGEKDSDTVGRANEDFSVSVYLGTVLQNPSATGLYTVTNTAVGAVDSTVIVECGVNISEPLIGLATCELKENESNYLSISNLELLLQWNDMRNVFNISSSCLWKSYAGTIIIHYILFNL